MGDLARGLHPPPRHSPLLSFGTVADCLPARLLLSSPLRSARAHLLVPPLSTTCAKVTEEGDGGEGHQRLSRFPRNRDLAGALHSTCILQRDVPPSPPSRPISFPTPTDNWRKLYAGVRRVKPMECLHRFNLFRRFDPWRRYASVRGQGSTRFETDCKLLKTCDLLLIAYSGVTSSD